MKLVMSGLLALGAIFSALVRKTKSLAGGTIVVIFILWMMGVPNYWLWAGALLLLFASTGVAFDILFAREKDSSRAWRTTFHEGIDRFYLLHPPDSRLVLGVHIENKETPPEYILVQWDNDRDVWLHGDVIFQPHHICLWTYLPYVDMDRLEVVKPT